ncbi:hypothetical protein LC607_17715 [Nostoc sp. CHAB 5824]|nr:hypothetical protein [Nostoc sp. CHAB 5824]
MNQDTYTKIEKAVPFLVKYFELDQTEQAWIYPYLDKSLRTTIGILNLIIDSSLSYEEIAFDLKINTNTVIQKINALDNGGFPLEIKADKAIYAPSRKRNLIRRTDEFASVVGKL